VGIDQTNPIKVIPVFQRSNASAFQYSNLKMYSLDDYDYELPPELVAQTPLRVRDQSRLLVLHRRGGRPSHHPFKALVDFLNPEDTLVVNDTEVILGRLHGRKPTGGRVEVLLLDYAGGRHCRGKFTSRCLVRASKPPGIGSEIVFDRELSAVVCDGESGIYTLEFRFYGEFEDHLAALGHVPLPPYIRRPPGGRAVDDRQAYQTVYAAAKGAVAAPTAGLHFTDGLLADIRRKGVRRVPITLHVGYGTFLPVRTVDIRRHRMHSERFSISSSAAEAVNATRGKGGRVFAVGTTCVRTLEYAADAAGHVQPGHGECDLFIYPGYDFKVVDAMITNFHLPRSTLLMLVSAFAGRESILAAYREAIQARYRFYSYGDAMLII
jgi:S-adenosylmethionine:tRNA ribosyltransferase-isomerase